MPPVKRQKRPRKTPTFKEAQFVKKYIEYNGNGAKAARASYDVKASSSPNLATQLLKKPIVKETLEIMMNKAGLSLDKLNEYSSKALEINIGHGKPSMAAGIAQLQFMYRLHNAVPAKKSMHVSLSHSERHTTKTYEESKKSLEETQIASKRLLEDLNT